jgi:hypothetical protein
MYSIYIPNVCLVWGFLDEMSGFKRFVPLTCFLFSFFLFGVLDGDGLGVHNQGDDDFCDAPSGGYTDPARVRGNLNTSGFGTVCFDDQSDS